MKRLILAVASVVLGLSSGCAGSTAQRPALEKVIIDSDYNTMNDDGQLGVMAAQWQARDELQVMGITVVSGNQWLSQGVADALKSMERLGVGERIGVYAGANKPLSRDLETIQREREQFPGGDGYLGAWSEPEPRSAADLRAPPDGFATHTSVQTRSAVDFIVDTVKAHPHEVTLLAVGPLTNIAQAVRRNPEIVPLVKQIIYMGGAVDVAGNTTATAEFNWWFDPEAVKTVLRQPIPQVVLPLDVTNTVLLDKATYDRVAHNPAKQTSVTQLFQKIVGYGFDGVNGFETNPNYTQDIWDTLALAYLRDPTLATETVEVWLDVDTAFGANDGRALGYTASPPAGLQKVKVVKRFDNARFLELYVDLLTRPVPVQ